MFNPIVYCCLCRQIQHSESSAGFCRSSHTRDQEPPPSQERLRENAADERWWDNGRRDTEKEPSPVSPDMSRTRERERSVSVERDQRSSSEERESGEI